MKLKLKPLSEEAAELYKDHGAYHEGDCGLDLFTIKELIVPPRTTSKIKFDISCSATKEIITVTNGQHGGAEVKNITVPTGYQLVPRSSISKTPLLLHNSVGQIDASYRGPIMAAVYNTGTEPYKVEAGTRLFQLISPTMEPINMEVVSELSETTRGVGGFGSTGS